MDTRTILLLAVQVVLVAGFVLTVAGARRIWRGFRRDGLLLQELPLVAARQAARSAAATIAAVEGLLAGRHVLPPALPGTAGGGYRAAEDCQTLEPVFEESGRAPGYGEG